MTFQHLSIAIFLDYHAINETRSPIEDGEKTNKKTEQSFKQVLTKNCINLRTERY